MNILNSWNNAELHKAVNTIVGSTLDGLNKLNLLHAVGISTFAPFSFRTRTKLTSLVTGAELNINVSDQSSDDSDQKDGSVIIVDANWFYPSNPDDEQNLDHVIWDHDDDVLGDLIVDFVGKEVFEPINK